MSTIQTPNKLLTEKSITYFLPVIRLSTDDITKINDCIRTTESNARANLLYTITIDDLQKAVYESWEVRKHQNKIKSVSITPQVWSKSKQYTTTATQLTVHFYKNGKIKKIEAIRANIPNTLCYHGYQLSEAIFY